MIIGIGTDIIEIKRIEEAIKKNSRFIKKCFTEKERILFKEKKNKIQTIAATFAAKEAVAKALGTGFRNFEFYDIEILRDKKGKPLVFLYRNAKEILKKFKRPQVLVSISHCKDYAIAYAVIEGEEIHESM
ncbi:holo-ACP synthase [Defluviitalea phaphyphila]|uniref:holo-ACP synthase n=1 Tax=Defluviitalea phaphyphila TaxID=1473580 RepID=UPI0007311DB6|nr:holo-ACP synthase [Defluviitalea phaphyphila]